MKNPCYEDREKETLFTDVGNANSCRHDVYHCVNSCLKKKKLDLRHDPSISVLSLYPKNSL